MKWKISARMCPAVFLLSLSLMSTAGARIITVDDDGPADFDNIQSAINDANDGDTVEVKPGTYTGPGNRYIRFKGKAITVRGTNPDDLNVVAATVIDCNQQGLGFIFENGEDANSVLSGLKIINGYNIMVTPDGCGGISCDGSSPIISNCILMGNKGRGGAIGATGYSDLVVRKCIIAYNSSETYGGGIFCTEIKSTTIENCIISHNTCTGWGGGIRSTSAEPMIIKNCIITGNKAKLGGGVSSRAPDVLIAGCVITGNCATERGGGIYMREYARPVILNSILCGNTAPEGPEIALYYARELPEYIGPPILCVSYCDIAGGQTDIYNDGSFSIDWGLGNIDVDPCFADPGYWGHIADPNIRVEPNDPNATWVEGGGDYHLKSQAGRWNAGEGGWTIDEVTSLCIDAGNPNYPIGPEPFPNGGRINMGAYGGTTEASKSYFDKPPCETIVAGDINGDCIVDFKDFAFLGRKWLTLDLEPPSPWRPGQANNPDPADGTIDPPLGGRSGRELTLKWQAGARADSHDIYFGTESPGQFQGNQTETEFLTYITFTSGTYYWRIDEINAYGKTTGTVWTFSFSPPAPATNPYPADGATSDGSMLSWTPGKRAASHDVYFGTTSPGDFQGNQTTNLFYPTPFPLPSNTKHYWRIDERNGAGVTTGTVWSFTAGGGTR